MTVFVCWLTVLFAEKKKKNCSMRHSATPRLQIQDLALWKTAFYAVPYLVCLETQ